MERRQMVIVLLFIYLYNRVSLQTCKLLNRYDEFIITYSLEALSIPGYYVSYIR